MSALLAVPEIEDQTEFNLNRWDELCADSEVARLRFRIETDRYGNITMNFPADFTHGSRQFDIGKLLKDALPHGKVSVECPISTLDGIKAADVVWVSPSRLLEIGGRAALRGAPEICVEVISLSNTRGEMEDKRRLYFEAGAHEVWICERGGVLHFFLKHAPHVDAGASLLCPSMPARID